MLVPNDNVKMIVDVGDQNYQNRHLHLLVASGASVSTDLWLLSTHFVPNIPHQLRCNRTALFLVQAQTANIWLGTIVGKILKLETAKC